MQPNQWPSGLTIEACLRYRIGTGTLNLDTTDLSKVAISTTAINKGEKKTTGQQPSSSSTKIDPETICCKTSEIFGWKLTSQKSQKSQNFILKLMLVPKKNKSYTSARTFLKDILLSRQHWLRPLNAHVEQKYDFDPTMKAPCNMKITKDEAHRITQKVITCRWGSGQWSTNHLEVAFLAKSGSGVATSPLHCLRCFRILGGITKQLEFSSRQILYFPGGVSSTWV